MQIGAIFPQTEIGSDPSVIRDFAQTAEGLGYSHILAYDHVLGALPEREPRLWGPYTHESAFHEPFVLFGYLAAITERVELVTGVIILPQRQTALVAKQAAEIDILSGGRLRLGPDSRAALVWARRHRHTAIDHVAVARPRHESRPAHGNRAAHRRDVCGGGGSTASAQRRPHLRDRIGHNVELHGV